MCRREEDRCGDEGEDLAKLYVLEVAAKSVLDKAPVKSLFGNGSEEKITENASGGERGEFEIPVGGSGKCGKKS